MRRSWGRGVGNIHSQDEWLIFINEGNCEKVEGGGGGADSVLDMAGEKKLVLFYSPLNKLKYFLKCSTHYFINNFPIINGY